MKQEILTISSENKDPLVQALLRKLEERHELIEDQDEKILALEEKVRKLDAKNKELNNEKEELNHENQELKEEITLLKNEIAELKKAPPRPKIIPNKKPKPIEKPNQTEEKPEPQKRPGSEKKPKILEIHETKVIRPKNLPEGSKLKRQRSFDVQDLQINVHNTRYILEEWETPNGEIYSAQMPKNHSQGHFGNELCAFILDQYHQCQVTQPLLHEQLIEFGIDISTGQLNNILTENNDLFHQEKDEILQAGLKVSSYIQTDDTGARHDGKNGYCTQIGNEFFAWFQSTDNKSRINFLQILNSSYPEAGYLLNEDAFKYMSEEGLPKIPFYLLENSIKKHFQNREEWDLWLLKFEITNKNHIKIATEAALLAGILNSGFNKDIVILSDGARQFNIPLLTHALCWIHEERHIKKLIPTTEENREVQKKILNDFWDLYRVIKSYKKDPTTELKSTIEITFDEIFQRKTEYALLDTVLNRIFQKKKELLVVLERTDTPLHNNGSETDIREFVKRKKVSGGTRNLAGQKSRDTFATLKKTCRKLGQQFYTYIKDRLSGTFKIAKLASLIEKAAAKNIETSEPLFEGVAA